GWLNGRVNQRVLEDVSNVVYAASGKDRGYLFFGREAALMAQLSDAAQGRLAGEPFTVAARVGSTLSSALPLSRRNVSVSSNGVLVFDPFPDRQRIQMTWTDRAGRESGRQDGMDNVSMVGLSPDDKRVVVSRSDFQTGANDLWISEATAGKFTRFTFDPANDIYPVWSPDGSRIVWSSNREGIYQLYEKAASGSGQDELLLRSDYFKFPTDWSHDGRFIIYREVDPKTKYD